VLIFGLWVLLVIVSLLVGAMAPKDCWTENDLVFGLPFPTLLLIAGLWIIPVFLLPLGFLLSFRRWLVK
jgi:hypothetical protein